MMPNVITVIVISCLVVLAHCGEPANDENKCDGIRCDGAQKVYGEVGCIPVTEDGECCPSRYDCSQLAALNSTQCHFKNQTLAVGKTLDDEETSFMCHAACQCSSPNEVGGRAYFDCARIECPEFFVEPDENCIWQTEKHRCCGKNKVCGKNRDSLHRCYLDGLEYFENQWMYPEQALCQRCWCDKSWKNETVEGNPSCEEIDCGIELMNLWRVQSGCVAIYFRDRKCCPIGWRCPTGQEDVVRHGKVADHLEENADLCTFGSVRLNIGDELVSPDHLNCKCTQPPFVDCIQAH